jgi:hypothetical protein
MFASVLIIGFSLVLLIYWFRYSCALLLRDRAQSAASPATVTDPRFGFGEVQRRLGGEEDLDPLQRSLRRDYEMLIYLIEHASGLGLESIEDRLLVVDYKFMQWQYSLTKSLFPSQARRALSEMASVLDVLVRRMSEQAGLSSQA